MATTPWLTSDDLIDIVKKRIAFPLSQNTLSEDDVLKFASYELFDSQVPSVMEYHEEFFVFSQEIPLEQGKTRYQIPDRAVGMALRDLMMRSSDGNLREMTRIPPENKAYYQQYGTTSNDIYRFYIEGDEIVLPNRDIFPGGNSLYVTYYLRPNSLVKNERAAIAKAFTKTLSVTNTGLLVGDVISVGNIDLVAGTDYSIGATSNATATNIGTALTSFGISNTVATNIVTIRSKSQKTEYSTTNAVSLTLQSGLGIEFESIPSNIVNESVIDFLQTKGGHKSYKIDVELSANAISGSIINFASGVIPESFIVGDYICLQNESIIPQIPSDLHSLLADRTCSRILMSIGDQAGHALSLNKIGDLERRQATIIDNRVEGAPVKVVNKFSILRMQKKTRRW